MERLNNAITLAHQFSQLVDPDQITELRVLKYKNGSYRPYTLGGFFDTKHLTEMMQAALERTMSAQGVYYTLNPLIPEVLDRRVNRIERAEEDELANNNDVLIRRWLPLDFDPVRRRGIGSTDLQKEKAREMALNAKEYLRGQGFPEPILNDSGNGFHLLYKIDLPTNDGELVKDILWLLAHRLDTQLVRIDQSVHNPGRIWKLPGTMARKGENTKDRPHRRASILELPNPVLEVPRKLLESLGMESRALQVELKEKAKTEQKKTNTYNMTGNKSYPFLLVEDWLKDRGVDYRTKGKQDDKGRTVYVLKSCPFDSSHVDPDACVMQRLDGQMSAMCLHDSCASFGWQEFKKKLGEPEGRHYRPCTNHNESSTSDKKSEGSPTNNGYQKGDNSRDSSDEVRMNLSSGWGPPATLPDMPPAPAFPLKLFPSVIADYWQAHSESMSVPVDYLGVPSLPILGATVGRSRAASVKRTYAEPPLLWCALVAPPGRAKSPSLQAAKGPLSSHTRRWREQHRHNQRTYDAEFASYEARMKVWKKNPDDNPPSKPERPVLTQLVIDKFTVESLVRINGDNPRGVVLVQDELSGLVTGLGQYKGGKGDDKQTMLSLWAGAEAEVNRVRDKEFGGMPLYIPHSFVGVAGMIQPDLLPLLRGDFGRATFINDGWADRFLLSFPTPPPLSEERWATVSEELERGYAGVFDNLFAMEMVAEAESGGSIHHRPYYINFNPQAKEAWQEFTHTIAQQANALDPLDNYIGVLSKLKHYGLRFITLFYCLRVACGELTGTSEIDGETVRLAAALVNYFEAHGRRCLGAGWADRTTRIAHRLLAWLLRNPDRKAFNRTEVFLALKDRRDVKSSEIFAPVFRLLIDHNYLRPLERPENARPGPIPETYLVNPTWDRNSQKLVPGIPTILHETEKHISNSRDSREAVPKDSAADRHDDVEEFTP